MQISRRSLVAAGISAAFVPAPATAARREVGPGIWEIGLDNMPMFSARQRCDSWCWAASLEAIFATWGYELDQSHFVNDLYPGEDRPCRTATDQQIIDVINRRHTDDNDRVFEGRHFVAKDRNTDPMNFFWWDAIKFELSRGYPLLGGYTHERGGHAVVVTQAIYRPNVGRPDDLFQLTIRDPWPGSPNRRQLSLNELYQIDLMICVSATPA